MGQHCDPTHFVYEVHSTSQYDYDEEIALKYELFSQKRFAEQALMRDPITGDPVSVFAEVGQYFMDTALTVESSTGQWIKHPDDVRLSVAHFLTKYVFEANDATLWQSVRSHLASFFGLLWTKGLIGTQGSVQVGLGQTMTTDDILNDKLIVQYELEFTDPLRDGLKSKKYYEDISRIVIDMNSSKSFQMHSLTLDDFGKQSDFDVSWLEIFPQ